MNYPERILAFVQIFFESLPVSSSTHVLLAKVALNKHLPTAVKLSQTSFFFWHVPSTLVFMGFAIHHIYKTLVQPNDSTHWQTLLRCAILIGLSCFPIALSQLLGRTKFNLGLSKFLVIGFMLSASVLLALKFIKKGHQTWVELSPGDALVSGIAQMFSLIPGVSRMTMTTASFYALGFKAKDCVFYSVCQQTLLTFGMMGKIFLSNSDPLNFFGMLNALDFLVLSLATIFGAANLYLTLWILKNRRTEIFFAYYIFISIILYSGTL